MDISAFDPSTASEADLVGHWRLSVESNKADGWDEPPLGYEQHVNALMDNTSPFGKAERWIARLDGTLVGVGVLWLPDDNNAHLGLIRITVHPDFRRRGIGTEILKYLTPILRADNRTVIESWNVDTGGAGELAAVAWGFASVHGRVVQRLVFADADRSLWEVAKPEGYRTERWIDAAPEELLASYVKARQAIHDAPLEGSGLSERQWSPELVREVEAVHREAGTELRVVVAVSEATGEIAGLTIVEVASARPERALQADTAVLAEHRGHGLGLFIKAEMMRWLTAERPEVQRILTSTGAPNTHMIRVNHELGMVTARSAVVLNQGIAELEASLARR